MFGIGAVCVYIYLYIYGSIQIHLEVAGHCTIVLCFAAPCASLLEHCGPCGHRCLALSSGSHPRGKDCRPSAPVSISAGAVRTTNCQQLAKRQSQFPTTTSWTTMVGVGATIRLRAPRRRLVLLWTTRVGQTFFWTHLLQAKPCSLRVWNRFLKKERRDNAGQVVHFVAWLAASSSTCFSATSTSSRRFILQPLSARRLCLLLVRLAPVMAQMWFTCWLVA